MKNKNKQASVKTKVATYVVIGILTFTMVFSVFASLVAAIQ